MSRLTLRLSAKCVPGNPPLLFRRSSHHSRECAHGNRRDAAKYTVPFACLPLDALRPASPKRCPSRSCRQCESMGIFVRDGQENRAATGHSPIRASCRRTRVGTDREGARCIGSLFIVQQWWTGWTFWSSWNALYFFLLLRQSGNERFPKNP